MGEDGVEESMTAGPERKERSRVVSVRRSPYWAGGGRRRGCCRPRGASRRCDCLMSPTDEEAAPAAGVLEDFVEEGWQRTSHCSREVS